MARFFIHPRFEFNEQTQRYEMVGHEGVYEAEPEMLFDRGAVNTAKNIGQQASGSAATSNANAGTDRASLIPGLIRDANNPTGLTAQQRNQFMVSNQEALGGTNAGLTGEANLASARTRSAGGFAPALAEAARQKMRSAATATQNVNNLDTQIGLQKQQQARNALEGLYGTDTSAALKSMGLEDEALNTQLQAGKQGWLQNTEGVIGTLANAAAPWAPKR